MPGLGYSDELPHEIDAQGQNPFFKDSDGNWLTIAECQSLAHYVLNKAERTECMLDQRYIEYAKYLIEHGIINEFPPGGDLTPTYIPKFKDRPKFGLRIPKKPE